MKRIILVVHDFIWVTIKNAIVGWFVHMHMRKTRYSGMIWLRYNQVHISWFGCPHRAKFRLKFIIRINFTIWMSGSRKYWFHWIPPSSTSSVVARNLFLGEPKPSEPEQDIFEIVFTKLWSFRGVCVSPPTPLHPFTTGTASPRSKHSSASVSPPGDSLESWSLNR